MNAELQKLRIDKATSRGEPRAKWPWVVVVLLLAGGGVGVWQYRKAAGVPIVETIRVVRRRRAGGGASNDLVVLNATGYIIAAHKIELASKVIGRVAWIGVEMGDKV